MDVESIFRNDYEGFITLEATVDTGFESVALDECKEKFGLHTSAIKSRGRIYFTIHQDDYSKVHELRCIDNLFLISAVTGDLNLSPATNKESDLEIIKCLPEALDWNTSLSIWKKCTNFNGILYPTEEEHANSLSAKLEQLEKLNCQGVTDRSVITEVLNTSSNILRFRVTCHRVGKNHSFGSMDAARDFGGKLHDIFHWVVDLTSFNIDIILNIIDNRAYVGMGLTRQSKHRRNIAYFGPTTLRATVCYGLLRLASPQPGDIVIDPLCGGGSIPIEGVLAYPSTYHVCGDSHDKAAERSRNNVQATCAASLIDVLQWDATHLPLRTSSIDVFVTDLPFGKRSGHKKDNRVLYKDVLLELGRVVRPSTGRAVLMTHDRRTFVRVLPQTKGMWKQVRVLGVNLGGLQAGVFQLIRTCKTYL